MSRRLLPLASGVSDFRAQDVPLGWMVLVQTDRDAERIRSQALTPFDLRVSRFVADGKAYAFPPDFFDPPELLGLMFS